ncbi:MAG: hypothetical protein ACLFMW_08955, partial [Ectothiorhodospira sp.]
MRVGDSTHQGSREILTGYRVGFAAPGWEGGHPPPGASRPPVLTERLYPAAPSSIWALLEASGCQLRRLAGDEPEQWKDADLESLQALVIDTSMIPDPGAERAFIEETVARSRPT